MESKKVIKRLVLKYAPIDKESIFELELQTLVVIAQKEGVEELSSILNK